MRLWWLAISSFFLVACPKNQETAKTKSDVCEDIADDIEALKREYPQLKEFKTSSALDAARCHIRYTFHCHDSTHPGGWTASVPNPDPDGLWFYISLWREDDPNEANAQINTQPVIPNWHIGDRRVTFLILEGDKTKPVSEEIMSIMKRHGLQ